MIHISVYNSKVLTHHIIRKSLTYLEEHIPNLDSRFFTVVHGDVNYKAAFQYQLQDQQSLHLPNLLRTTHPYQIITNYSLSREVLTHHIIRKSLTYLEEHIPNLDSRFFTVVHLF
jgi:thiamine kinase-like enzyme